MDITTILPDQYPHLLKQTSGQPDHLDYIGEFPSDEHKFLCVIGARRYSAYGMESCIKLIKGLKGYPVVIVSGLAIGIDSIAHETALSVGLKTIAFPGSGLSKYALYPVQHRDLAERIYRSGNTLVSPFKPEQLAAKWTFPARNQLMAAVSHATIIIEARAKSGTMTTAEAAGKFGRDVLAVPGSIFSDLSYGPHELLRDGATAVTCPEDILEALGLIEDRDQFQLALPDISRLSLPAECSLIFEHLKNGPVSGSDLIDKTGLASERFNAFMSYLELENLITQANGMYRIST